MIAQLKRRGQCIAACMTIAILVTACTPVFPVGDSDLCAPQFASLWSCGKTSIRTGLPLIFEGGEHQVDENLISYGYNAVLNSEGEVVEPTAAPLEGGESMVLIIVYEEDVNTREYARVVSIMAPIRDAILYHFEETTRDTWLELTAVLTLNDIKVDDAPAMNGQAILSTPQVYDYVASGNAQGSPVARYLEEAELELKCLAFQGFDFTNPEGVNHCAENGFNSGSGIKFPPTP
jgi:hypothetical protein